MTTAFVDGTVFVGDGRILEHANVFVEGDRIVKVAEGSMPIPRDVVRKISLAGHTLLPGFIDSHVHLCLDGSPDPVGAAMSETLPMTALKAAQFAHRTLMGGVTSVRDMGGREGIDLSLREQR